MRFVSILLLILTLASCSKDDAPPAPTPLDKAKEVTAFSLKRANGTPFSASEYQVQIKTDTVSVTVPAGTDLNGLIPEITITGKTISPASGVAQNFNFPVVYTVTAEDGSQAKYTVIIRAQVPAGIVYFGSSDNSFYAVDALTGKVVWRHIGTQSFVYSSPTYANGTIYVGSIDNYVYAFDAATGVVKWKYLMGTTGIESDAVVFDGTVYVGCNDDFIVALDATTGAFKWKFTSGANISASPTVYNGVVYFGSSDGKLYALNASNGDLKWSFQTGAMINQSGPALVNGVVYVGSRDAHLYAINATTGAQIWRYSTNGISLENSSPTVANGVVYIGGWYDVPGFTRKGSLYAINATTGQLVWEKLQNTGIGSSPVVANGRVFITGDDLNLHALEESTGNIIWSQRILANGASAAVSNGVVYVGGGGTRYFYAFDAATSVEKWRFSVPQGLMTSSPLIVSASKADFAGDSGNLN